MTAPRPFHRQRPLAVSAAAYGLGVWAGASFVWRPALYGLGFACGAIAALLLPRLGRGRIGGILTAALFLGMLLGGRAANPALPEPGRYRVTGILTADAALREDGTAAAYLTQTVLNDETALPALYWTYTPDPDAPFLPLEGDRVSFTGNVYHPSGRMNPYGFDFRQFLLQRGVPAGVSGAGEAETLDHPGRGLASRLYALRQALLSRARQVFGEDSALPAALLLGERSDLPQETQKSFADAGVAHLLAVSGLHVGLIAAWVLIPLRRWLSPRGRLAVMSAFLLFYSALLGFPAPVLRASLLMLLTLIRRVVRRSPDPLTALCAAFWLILLIRPLDLFSASFQLSFCAVLGIVLFGPALERRLERVQPRFLREGWISTFSATAGVTLPTIQLFHRFSFMGLAVNPFLCALFAALLPLYAVTLLAGCLYLPAGVWLGGWVNPVTRGLIRAVSWLGGLPFASVRVPFLPWYCVACAAAALALASRYCLGKRRRKACIAAALLTLSFAAWRLTLCRDVQYIQLAVGQADAALLLDGGETVVIDAGDYGGDAASYLLSTGRQADRVILTHLHSDHCMGLRQLLEQDILIGAVYLPEGAEEQQVDPQCLTLLDEVRAREIPVYYLAAGDSVATARTALTVTWPFRGSVIPGQDANRFSMALLCELDGVTLLNMADLSGDYEVYAARDADVLKVGHHGSKSGTGEELLRLASPQAAVITSSPASRVLPSQDTLSRLRERGVQIFDTASCGAVTLTIRQGEATLTSYLNPKEQP